MTLTEFLLARLDEDEAAARSAIDDRKPGTHWRWERFDDEVPPAFRLRTEEEYPTAVGDLPALPIGYEAVVEETRALDHIARHDPARVLAEVAAKRAIVERETSDVDETDVVLLRILAAVYADHPDYLDEWRPGGAEPYSRVVEYRGIKLRLTFDQYVALKEAAFDDPVKADQMAQEYLKAQGWVRLGGVHACSYQPFGDGRCVECGKPAPPPIWKLP